MSLSEVERHFEANSLVCQELDLSIVNDGIFVWWYIKFFG